MSAVTVATLLLGLALCVRSAPPCGTPSDPVCVQSCAQTIVQAWEGGYSTDVHLTFPRTVENYTAVLTFDKPLAHMETWASQLVRDDNQTYTLSNNPWDGHHEAGSTEVVFLMVTDQDPHSASTLTSVDLVGTELCKV